MALGQLPGAGPESSWELGIRALANNQPNISPSAASGRPPGSSREAGGSPQQPPAAPPSVSPSLPHSRDEGGAPPRGRVRAESPNAGSRRARAAGARGMGCRSPPGGTQLPGGPPAARETEPQGRTWVSEPGCPARPLPPARRGPLTARPAGVSPRGGRCPRSEPPGHPRALRRSAGRAGAGRLGALSSRRGPLACAPGAGPPPGPAGGRRRLGLLPPAEGGCGEGSGRRGGRFFEGRERSSGGGGAPWHLGRRGGPSARGPTRRVRTFETGARRLARPRGNSAGSRPPRPAWSRRQDAGLRALCALDRGRGNRG